MLTIALMEVKMLAGEIKAATNQATATLAQNSASNFNCEFVQVNLTN